MKLSSQVTNKYGKMRKLTGYRTHGLETLDPFNLFYSEKSPDHLQPSGGGRLNVIPPQVLLINSRSSKRFFDEILAIFRL